MIGKYTTGKNGWLFLNNDSNNITAQNRGEIILSDEQILAWKKLLLEQKKFCKARKIKFCQLIVPDTSTILIEKLAGETLATTRPITQVLSMCKENGLDIIYPFGNFERKDLEKCFIKNDSHWSDYGAYLCSNLALAKLGLKSLDIDISFRKKRFVGDLEIKKDNPSYCYTYKAFIKNPKVAKIFDNNIKNLGKCIIFQSEDHTLGDCVIFGNSYCEYGFLEVISNQFFNTYFVFDKVFDYSLIDDIKPKYVIMQYAERMFIRPFPSNELISRSVGALKIFAELMENCTERKKITDDGMRLKLSESLLHKSITLLFQNERSKSNDCFQKLIVKEPNPVFYYVYGKAFRAIQEWEKAVFYFEKAFESDKFNVNYISELTYCHYKLGNHQAADLHFSTLKQLNK